MEVMAKDKEQHKGKGKSQKIIEKTTNRKIVIPKNAGKMPGEASLELRRKGAHKLEVSGHVNIGGNEIKVRYEYNFRVGPSEMLDLFQEQFGFAIQELNSDNVTTADEAVAFFIEAMVMMGEVTRANDAMIISKEE